MKRYSKIDLLSTQSLVLGFRRNVHFFVLLIMDLCVYEKIMKKLSFGELFSMALMLFLHIL